MVALQLIPTYPSVELARRTVSRLVAYREPPSRVRVFHSLSWDTTHPWPCADRFDELLQFADPGGYTRGHRLAPDLRTGLPTGVELHCRPEYRWPPHKPVRAVGTPGTPGYSSREDRLDALNTLFDQYKDLGVLLRASPPVDQFEKAYPKGEPPAARKARLRNKSVLIRRACTTFTVGNKGLPDGRLITDLTMKGLMNANGVNSTIPEHMRRILGMLTMGRMRKDIATLFTFYKTRRLAGMTADAKSFFFNFLMAPKDREMIGVIIENRQGVFEYWRFECHPFGLASAPFNCCAISSLITRTIRKAYPALAQGLFVYVDDFIAWTRIEWRDALWSALTKTLTYVGIPIGGSQPPSVGSALSANQGPWDPKVWDTARKRKDLLTSDRFNLYPAPPMPKHTRAYSGTIDPCVTEALGVMWYTDLDRTCTRPSCRFRPHTHSEGLSRVSGHKRHELLSTLQGLCPVGRGGNPDLTIPFKQLQKLLGRLYNILQIAPRGLPSFNILQKNLNSMLMIERAVKGDKSTGQKPNRLHKNYRGWERTYAANCRGTSTLRCRYLPEHGYPHEARLRAEALLEYLVEGLPILDWRSADKIVCCYSDASDSGLSGLICGTGTLWACNLTHPDSVIGRWHITATECVALIETVRRICNTKAPGDRILIRAWVDNSGLKAMINNRRASNTAMDYLVQKLWDMLRYHKCWIHCYWLSTSNNIVADAGSRIFEDLRLYGHPCPRLRLDALATARTYARFPQLLQHSPHWRYVPRQDRYARGPHDMAIQGPVEITPEADIWYVTLAPPSPLFLTPLMRRV